MECYGLLGEKLSHSLSPKLHKHIFEELNIKGDYKLFEVKREDINDFMNSLKSSNIKGINVTIPYKEVVIKYLDELSREAKKIGAINTIFNKNGKLVGYNTDYYGFKYMLEDKHICVKNKRVTVLGTGGASKAVIQYLLDEEALEINLVSRTEKKLYADEEKIKVITYDDINNKSGDIIINTTPVGMFPNNDFLPVSEEIIKKYDVLVDLIYNPLETKFIKLGIKNNKIVCGGLMMLVGQAIKAEEIWQERSIDKKVIIEIYKRLINNFK